MLYLISVIYKYRSTESQNNDVISISQSVYETCPKNLHASLPRIHRSTIEEQIESDPIDIVLIKSDRINENKQ